MYTSDHPTALPQARRWAHIIEAEANQDATPMVAAAQYTRAFAAIAQAEMLDGIAAAQIAQSRAAQRMAEAAERQAAAMEGIYRMLRYIAPAIEYQAAGDVSPEFKAGAAVEAVHADNVDSDPYDDGYNGPRADLFSGRDDDQRAEDEAGYNAGIAPGLHR